MNQSNEIVRNNFQFNQINDMSPIEHKDLIIDDAHEKQRLGKADVVVVSFMIIC